LTDVVVTQNSSPRSMPAEELADRARSVLGAGRVTVEPHLPAAIDTALRRAAPWPEDVPDAAVVLVTGSVVTAGEVRALLTGGAARDPAPAHLPTAASVLT
jgi:dihydrofolate synthase/folylpolyglutamate synthase